MVFIAVFGGSSIVHSSKVFDNSKEPRDCCFPGSQVQESFGRKDIEAFECYEFLRLVQRAREKRDELVAHEQQQRRLVLVEFFNKQDDPELLTISRRCFRPSVFRKLGDVLPTK